MKKLKRIVAMALLIVLTMSASVAYAATGKVTTINMTNLFDAYNSTKKTWNELKTAKHRLMGSFSAYCLQHKATVPNSQSYNLTDLMDNYSAKVRKGLQIIVENGYPFNKGGLTAAQAEYATANAIRFWLSECGDDQFYNMTNLGSFSNSKLRTLAAGGVITKKIQVRDASYIPALQFAVELLIKARAQVLMEHEIGLSTGNISAERSDNVFKGNTTVTTVNLNGGYTLDKSALPSGSTVTGFTGKNGDVLTISIPASAATANQTYTLTLTGKDDRVRNNIQVFCHNSNQAYQRVLCVRTGSSWYAECATATLTVTTGDYVTSKPDLTVTSLTADSASYETGEMMTFTATVKNQGTSAAGSANLSLSGSSIATQKQAIGSLAIGATKQLTFSAPVPDTAQTLTVTTFADCDERITESKAGESVTFSVIEQTGKDVSVTGATKNTDGTYTVTPTENTTVTITYTDKIYSVTVEGTGADNVTCESTATHGVEYTFTVTEESGYNYEVSATVGGKAVTLSGSYTIAAADVTGDIVITVTKSEVIVPPTPETYTVTVYKNGAQDSSGSATEGQSYSFTAADGYKVIKVTIGGAEFTSYTFTDSVLTIPAGSVTGNIEIYLGGVYTVTLPGADTPEDDTDDTVTGAPEANYGTDYTFTVEDGYETTVTIGGEPADVTDNGDGSYTIPGGKITGEIVITTAKIIYTESVEVYDYVKSENAAVIQLVVAVAKEGALAEGEILQYNGANMFWSSKYNGYAYLVLVEESEELLTKEAAAALIGVTKATAAEIVYNGNVNMTANDVVDVNDAQLVYDIYKAMYSSFDKVSMEKMLRADMNANSADVNATYGLTVNDVASVMAIVNAK